MKISCWISFLFVLLLSNAFAQNEIESGGRFSIDRGSKETVSSFEKLPFEALKERQVVNIGYNVNDAIWCIIKCRNTTDHEAKKLLVFDNIFLDSISWWMNGAHGVMGDRTAMQDEYISGYTLPVELAPHDSTEIRIRIKKTISLLHFSYQIKSQASVSKESREHLSIVSVFLGVLIFSIFFYCFILFKNRKRIYYIFILYALVSCMYIIITSGFARYVLTPKLFYLGEFRIFSGSFWYVLVGWFFIEFLETKKHHPIYHRIFVVAILFLTSLILAAILLVVLKMYAPLKILTFIAYAHYLAIMLLILLCTIRHFRFNVQNSIYALVAFSSHFVWQTTGLLTTFKLFPDNTKLDWFIYASVFQGILFGYVLAKGYIRAFYQSISLGQEIIEEKQRTIQSISQAQVAERRKIASILHDNFGVKIAQILHLSELGEKKELTKQIHDLSEDIRNVSHSILPRSLDDGALLRSILNHLEIIRSARPEVKLELNAFDFPEKTGSEWRFDLYLISLEIIHNAIRHGEATEIDLEFYAYPDCYVFQYTDNGKGFDVSASPGFGLTSMKRRIEQFGGHFEISSEAGEGTVIQIQLPVNSNNPIYSS